MLWNLKIGWKYWKIWKKIIILTIEEDQKHIKTRKMYQTINQFKKQYQHTLVILRIHHTNSHTCTTSIHNPILKECHNPAQP